MVHDGKHYPKLKLTPVVTGTFKKKSLIKKKEKKKRKVFKRPKFLGFVSYEWVFFSLNCTALTRPLTNLTKIDSDLVKQPLCREPHLRSPYLSPIYSAG